MDETVCARVHTVAAEPAVFGVFVQIVADNPRHPPAPANTSVCVFLAKPPGPFVHRSSQLVSLLGLSHSSHTLSSRQQASNGGSQRN